MQKATETSENREHEDGDDFSEYRKSLRTYVDHNLKTSGEINSPILNKPLNYSD
jgi:hypothetical protein